MRKLSKIAALITLSMLMLSCASDNKVMLFNGKDLDNWNIYVSGDEAAPGDLFWVEDEMIQTSGKPNGYIRTKESYSNYELHVEWRWVEEPTNSGVLLHVQGEDRALPTSIECQLKHEHAGDIVLLGTGSGITVEDSTYLIGAGDPWYLVIPKMEEISEKPAGEWNSYDITSLDGTVNVKVNGVLQNVGSDMTRTEGNILLQAEGSAIQFRNIYLKPL